MVDNVEIVEDESLLAGGNLGQSSKEKQMEQAMRISEFTFSEEDPNDRLVEFIDLAVPVQYKVKFNFTPEK